MLAPVPTCSHVFPELFREPGTDFLAKARRLTLEERYIAARRRALAPLRGDIEAAFRRAVREVSSQASLRQLVAAVESGDPASLEAALRWPELGQPILDVATRQVLLDSLASGGTAEVTLTLGRALYSLDITTPEAIAWLRSEGALSLGRSVNVRLDALRAVLDRSVRAGRTATEVAREIRDARLVGLTERQVWSVARFREGLRQAGVRPDIAAQRVARRAQRALNYRAELIARDQTTRAYAAGQRALWAQARRDGLIGAAAQVEWVVVDPCPICAPLAGLRIPLGGSFPSGWWPGDPHPACECMAILHPAG